MFKAVVFLSLVCAAHCQAGFGQETTASATREARIAAHRQRIEEIIAAHRMVDMYSEGQDTSGTLPRVASPAIFESTLVPALREAQLSPEQLTRLREINTRLWNLSHEKETTSPEVGAKVRQLLAEQAYELTSGQREAAFNAYMTLRHENQRRPRATPAPEKH